ncbi:hypothetical protein GCM10023187_22270 [Nibrella viscosa]|uniref:Uncharacterized protein n=1 Tax=Nibrella viscosa TaxID=1084524 RepID=A0ABP8KE45_9BACT
MHHISGLRDQWNLLVMAGCQMDNVITKEHIFNLVRRQKELNFEPGSQVSCCRMSNGRVRNLWFKRLPDDIGEEELPVANKECEKAQVKSSI